MKSGDLFGDNYPHFIQPGAQQVQAVCGICNHGIALQTACQIDGVASCWYCWKDHVISRNVCPCPYRLPQPRKWIERPNTEKDLAWTGLASCSMTTVAQTETFIKNPTGGL